MRNTFNHAKIARTILLVVFLAFPTSVLAAAHSQTYGERRLTVGQSLEKPALFPTYDVIDLGTLGGVFSSASTISDRGWVNGTSSLRGDRTEHAVVWRGGRIIDLGTLGGLDSSAAFPVNDD